MRIHALTTGHVRLKRSFLYPSPGLRRQLDLFLPDEWSEPVPIHCWAIEHESRLTLVDTGESAAARNIPCARFEVAPEQELPHALRAAGLAVEDVSAVLLTHHHGDHVDGLVHIGVPAYIHEAEIAHLRSAFPALMRRVLRQPLPPGFAPRTFTTDDEPFGAFPRSRRFSDDGRILAVETPGHTPGHVAFLCVDDDGRHVMLAGDATDTLEQLHDRRADAVGPDPKAHRETLERILEHCRLHPTVYLPSHDPESLQRLRDGVTVKDG
jgi:glyoxylase-like metal-dependent hydrolase (beta-lactamase superfamily II)